MNKTVLKRTALALAAGLALLLAAAAVLVWRFDPNAHKAWLIERVQQDRQRTLAIPGRISLSLFPSLGLQVGEISLSARGSDRPFAAARSLRASLAVWPLFGGRLVVDRVRLDGLQVQVLRLADGSTSIDDLWSPTGPTEPSASSAPKVEATPPTESGALQFDIAGLSLSDATLRWDDRRDGRQFSLSGASLDTGRLRPGQPVAVTFKGRVQADKPRVDAALNLKATLLSDPAQGRHTLSGLVAEVKGQLATLADADLRLSGDASLATAPRLLALSGIQASLRGRLPQGPLDARLTLSQLKLTGDDLSGGAVTLSADLSLGQRKLQATLGGSLQGDLKAGTFALSALDLQASLPKPGGGALALKAGGSLNAETAGPLVRTRLKGEIDGSRFAADLSMKGAAPAVWRIELDVDRLDLDRFQAVAAAAASAPSAGGAAAVQPIDLSTLQGIDASGTLRVGSLQAASMQLADLRADFRVRGGRLDVDPLVARLYQGSMAGSLSAEAGKLPRLALTQQLSEVAVGPLLKDAIGQDRLSGRGDVRLDVVAKGATLQALKQNLSGNASLSLRDGAVRGFNIAQAIRRAKAALGRDAATAAAPSTESSDFSELAGSFLIADGVARTDDLGAKSPLLRVAVQGDIDIGRSRLDLGVKATIVSTLQGQGGPELQALRGATLPVRLSGPFDAVSVKVDTAGAVESVAREKVEGEVRKIEDKLRNRLGDKLKGLFGR